MSDPATPQDALRQAAALVYVEDLDREPIEVPDMHHLVNVLRLRDGERVAAADGEGSFRLCRLMLPAGAGRRSSSAATLSPLSATQHEAPLAPRLTVGFGMPKGDRAEWAVQKLTELGVDRIVPLLTERTVVRLSETERRARGDRLRKIAREAGAQSRRPRLPEVADPLPFATFAASLGGSARLAEPGGAGELAGCDTILVGPEGGWSATELGCGVGTLGLGNGVLRAETAAVVAGALLAGLRSGLVTTR